VNEYRAIHAGSTGETVELTTTSLKLYAAAWLKGMVKKAALQCNSLNGGDVSVTRNRLSTELSTGKGTNSRDRPRISNRECGQLRTSYSLLTNPIE
jgi:hypothetical protein